ncbi:MAG: hypothetical protein AAGG01_05245 [Planctomycetota bacterium]
MSDSQNDPASTSEPQAAASTPDHTHKPQKKESIWEVYYPFNADAEKDSVPVASFPMIIYFWPSLVAFLTCGLVQMFGEAGVQSTTLGWWATAALAFNLMIIVTDLDQKKFIIVMLLLGMGALALKIGQLQEWAIIGDVGHWIADRQISYSTDAYLAIGLVLLFFFLLGISQPRLNYWRLEPNEFVHYIQPWGRDQSIPRLGSTVTREVPDVLELILTFGGGTIVIKRENQVVARIEHVPFLGKRMKTIERLLGVTRVKHT